MARGWCSGDNPADSKGVLAVYLEPLKTARKKPQNYAAADFNKVPLLIKALLSKKTSSYLLTAFSIVTVLRAKMARLARWSDVDLKKRILRVPEANFKTKGRGDHIVYLSSAAKKILNLLPKYSDTGYLFPSPRTMLALSDNAMRAVLQQLHEEKLARDGIGWIDPILSQKTGTPCMITQHAQREQASRPGPAQVKTVRNLTPMPLSSAWLTILGTTTTAHTIEPPWKRNVVKSWKRGEIIAYPRQATCCDKIIGFS